MPKERLQDGYASADEARVDLDDAPDEGVRCDPRAIGGREVQDRVDEADNCYGPVSVSGGVSLTVAAHSDYWE